MGILEPQDHIKVVAVGIDTVCKRALLISAFIRMFNASV